MTNYSENPGMVRVDYFKPSGKWYMTEAIDMSAAWDDIDIYRAVRHSLNYAWVAHHNGRGDAWRQFTIVILEPYHKNAYPIMIKAEEQS